MNNGQGDPRFYRLLDEIANLHAKKSTDYSPGDDPLSNFRASAEFGVRPYLGVLTRLRDKWGRICTFAKSGQLQNESARDSHIDSAVYHLIAVMLLDDEPRPASLRADSLGGVMRFTDTDVAWIDELSTTGNTVPVSVAGSDEPAKVYIGEDSTTPDRDCIIGHV